MLEGHFLCIQEKSFHYQLIALFDRELIYPALHGSAYCVEALLSWNKGVVRRDSAGGKVCLEISL